ncbi:hypothetical protein [Pseudomonas xantholysinigenes]|uniref:Uncharacterized protein n=1 Tax=Pseudomonas xantholysinigenes TaxID=2745490 RepID=A0A9E6PZG5_9PSED|nr:hypothetical protein [Pseudomonas xantholysinigenes]QXI39732.1 hypothetical protein HU772_006510 [Pseudomonas xantholysinigenes]
MYSESGPDRRADLKAPEVDAIIKDENQQPRADGLLPIKALEAPVRVVLPGGYADPRLPSVILDLGWQFQGAPFNSVYQDTLTPPYEDEFELFIPTALLNHGVYDLQYKITQLGVPSFSLKRTITVDTQAPNYGMPGYALQVQDVPGGEITEEYLAQHGEVRFKVPMYSVARPEDTVELFWSDQNPPPSDENAVHTKRVTQAEIDSDTILVAYDAAVIRASGSGLRYPWYRLKDLAGNIGPAAPVVQTPVDLTPGPSDLLAPRVMLSVRGLIDREHAREGANGEGGLVVEIDHYDNASDQDHAIISWQGFKLSERPVDPTGFPLRAFVPWPAQVVGGLGPDDALVQYEIRRNLQLTPSPVTSVPFDLRVAGQDHTAAPALLNRLLTLLEVRGRKSDQANKLEPIDHGLDARVLMQLFDNPQPDERVLVYWGNPHQHVAQYIVKAGDQPAKPIEISVPWAIIEQQPNDRALPVWYRTDNGVNQQLANSTLVDVAVELIRDLPPPTFPHADKWGYLNCCSIPRLWEGVSVRVEPHALIQAGDTLELNWQGHDSLNGSSPIPGVAATFRREVSTAEATQGCVFVVLPYDTLIEPMVSNASATADYRLLKQDGRVGISKRDVVKITRAMPSGEVCSPSNDLCDKAID